MLDLETLVDVRRILAEYLTGYHSDRGFAELLEIASKINQEIMRLREKERIEDEAKEEIKEEKKDKKEESLSILKNNYNVFAKYEDEEEIVPIFRNNNLKEVISFLEKQKDIFEKQYHDFFIVDIFGITITKWSAYSFSDFIDNLKNFINKALRD